MHPGFRGLDHLMIARDFRVVFFLSFADSIIEVGIFRTHHFGHVIVFPGDGAGDSAEARRIRGDGGCSDEGLGDDAGHQAISLFIEVQTVGSERRVVFSIRQLAGVEQIDVESTAGAGGHEDGFRVSANSFVAHGRGWPGAPALHGGRGQ